MTDQKNIRFIHTVHTQWELKDLLQTIFVSEWLMPSRCLWLVSPWLTDITIIDNRANQFISLEPDWTRRKINFTDILSKLAELGTIVRIATRPDVHNDHFESELRRKCGRWNHRIFFEKQTILHIKGILGDHYYLSGSMNFSISGITINEESLQYITDRSLVSQNRITYADRWGDENI